MNDEDYMRAALSLARQGLGKVWPNPSVGCVIVREGRVLSACRTGDGGRPHAEQIAISRAGADLKGATVYITLEPCAHEREDGPCCALIAASGITRAVIACADPDQRTAGKGLEAVQRAGIKTVSGVLESEARALNRGFFLNRLENRPMFSIKIASTIDAQIAVSSGESRWITGELARLRGHLERASHDAVLTGIGTVLSDDPELTCRLGGDHRGPLRIVIDTHLRIEERSRLLATLHAGPVWIVTSVAESVDKFRRLVDKGVDILRVSADESGKCDLRETAGVLASRGITRVMVEAGPKLNGAFIRAGLYDRLLWFRAASLIGGDGRPAIDTINVRRLAERLQLNRLETQGLGQDCLEIYERPA